ncbi:MAG: TrkA family potassium uptake protein [Leptospiraceae bacterium]|nr:TrkA family potassium uptake protein [Leptospiraceae bacterium]MCP5513574.1 TrkA family potassium uptake protein [Leptospiraceae bacterium]
MNEKKIAVIGLGGFGKELVKCLHEEQHEVMAIDVNKDLIEDIKEDCTNAVCLDATDENVMKAQGLNEFDFVILAVADDFETLIITADILKRIGVKEIIARYQTELHVRILKMLGITHIFNPEEKAAKNMAEMFSHSNMRGSTIITEEFRIAELIVPKNFVGKTLGEVKLKEKYKLLLITIKRSKPNPLAKRKGDQPIEESIGIPSLHTQFRNNDVMVVFGAHDDVEKFLTTF